MPNERGTVPSTEWANQLVEAAPDAMIVVDPDGIILLVNLQAERLFGYARPELLGQRIEVLLPERFRGRHVGHRESFARAPKVRPMGAGLELKARKRDGTEVDVEISLSPIETDAGRFMACAIRDISDRRRIEARAQRTTSYLKSSVDSIADTFLLCDEHDRLVIVNSAARTLLGQALEGPIEGRPFPEIVDAALASGILDDAGEARAQLRSRLLAYHQAPLGSMELRTSGGRALRMTERRTAEGGTVTVIADVTEDVQREDELEKARARAEEASAAKSEFLSSMSHELRTPLNAVLGFAQLLQRDKRAPLNERQHDRLAHVLRGGEHLLRLIDDVLDLSRIEAGRVTMSTEAVGPSEVLDKVTTTLEPLASRAEITMVPPSLPPDLVSVKADRTRLSQILMNYGSNAIKYGRKGGHLWFHVEAVESAVRFTVKDDGMGIPEAHRARIFEPFHRAGQETGPIEGTGIGLAISKRLAELMGGAVGFSSEEGKGSAFWVEVPRHDVDDTEAQARTAVPHDVLARMSTGPKRTIVYVEDNPSNIAFMRELLGDFESIELLTAPTAEIGLELCRARRPAIVIMDINLPGMSGFEARRRLLDWPETKDIPVIALSAAAMPRDKERGVELGFYRYLTKPVQIDALTSVLEALLGADTGEPPQS
jgi:PAS domain S-box-containing protein